MSEQRVAHRMIDHWKRLKGEKELPNFALFNHAIIQDIWPQCMHLGVFHSTTGAPHYCYNYIGEALAKALGNDIKTGMRVTSHMGHSPLLKILKRLDNLLDAPDVVMEEGQFINDKNKIIKYRSCLLPFGPQKVQVTDIVIGFSWHTF